MDHSNCKTTIKELENELASLREELVKKEERQDKGQVKRKRNKDSAVGHLIEMIEQDTQEIRSIGNSSHTVTTGKRTKRTITGPPPNPAPVSASSNRYARKSPISNVSEMDLWSIFSKADKK